MYVLKGHLQCENLWIWDQKVSGDLPPTPGNVGHPITHERGRMQNLLQTGFPTCRARVHMEGRARVRTVLAFRSGS